MDVRPPVIPVACVRHVRCNPVGVLRTAATHALVLAFTLAGCSPASRPARVASVPVASIAPASAGASEKLQVAAKQTRLSAIAIGAHDSVDLDVEGTMLDVASGTRIVVGQRVFTLVKDREDAAYHCHIDYDHGPYDYDGSYRGDGVTLVDERGKEKVVVAKIERGDPDDSGMAIDEQKTTLVGVVGSYLFVREDRLVYGCGAAHPMHGASGFVWDAERDERVELVPPAGVVASVRQKLAGRGFAESEPKLVEVIPHFDLLGRLSLGWRFEKGTSYAETDGGGSDYTVSVTVDSMDLPDALARFAEPPPAIRNHLGGEPLLGWSRPN